MPVKNIECQIAQAQIGRYLSGDVFDGEALSQLEAHVSRCPDCGGVLSQKKAALQAMLGGNLLASAPASETTSIEDEPELNPAVAAFLKKQKASPKPAKAVVEQTVEKPTNPSTFWKPLIYSGALAAVLIGMSFVAKNPTSLFGTKAAAAPAATNATEPAKDEEPSPITASTVPGFKESEETEEPDVTDLKPGEQTGQLPEPPKNALDTVPEQGLPISGDSTTATVTEEKEPKQEEVKTPQPTAAAKPKTETAKPEAVKPKPVVKKPVTKRKRNTRRTTSSIPYTAPRSSGRSNSIRVYDAAGNPIN